MKIHKRKIHRHFKSKRRTAIKSFKRKLNSVAEKKMTSLIQAYTPILSSGAGTGMMFNMMLNSFPGAGSNSNQRIGTKIFVRYVYCTILITNTDATHWTSGKVGVLWCKEKSAGSGNVAINAIHAASQNPMVDCTLLKQNYSKMKLKTYELQAGAVVSNAGVYTSDIPYHKVIKKRFKIMREVEIRAGGTLNQADWQLTVEYYAAPWSFQGATGPASVALLLQMSFTDV